MTLRCRRFRCHFLAAWVVVLAALVPGTSSRADDPAEKTWGDGICIYDLSPPLDAYFVPPAVFENGYDVPPKRVLAASRRMTPAELDGFVRGGKQRVTREYPLFVFNNHRVNVFLWKGKHDGEQQIVPRCWDGEVWMPSGTSGDGRADAVEQVFYQPADRDRCYVMVSQQNGQVGRDRIHTDRVFFGPFPPVEAVLRKGIESADVVVYRPYREASLKGELLDCLKGGITLSEWRKLPGAERVGYNTFAFIAGTDGQRKVRSTYSESDVYGTFRGDYGEVSLSVPQVRAAVAKDPPLNAYVKPGPLRWEIARAAAGPRQKVVACRLRVVNPEAPRGEWVVVELTVGRDQPDALYRLPQNRAQSDGGDPLIRFQVRQGDAEVELVPRGRFGSDSLQRAAPEENAALGIEYQFIDCGQGVLKLALRPKQHPWAGTVRGRYEELVSPFDRRTPPVVHLSQGVRLEVK
jgi:hypothetical protein